MMSKAEIADLAWRCERANYEKCSNLRAVPYRVVGGGLIVEVWARPENQWAKLREFATKAEAARWERSREIRDAFVPHNRLHLMASKPWTAKVVRLQADADGNYAIKVGPTWTHEGSVGGKLLYARLLELADDRHTIIDHGADAIARMLTAACGAPQTAAVAAVTTIHEAQVTAFRALPSPEVVTAQYRRAVAGCLEMIRFGAMLMDVESELERGRSANRYTSGNGGLQAWMAENCPEVNYKTALRFKGLAEGLQFHCRIPAGWPVALALPSGTGPERVSPDEAELLGGLHIKPKRLEQMRKEVWDFLEGKSARQLMFDFGTAETKPKGGDRRSGLKMTEEEKAERAIEHARHIWIGHLDDLLGEARTVGSLLLFDEGLLDALLLKIDTVRDAVKAAKGGVK